MELKIRNSRKRKRKKEYTFIARKTRFPRNLKDLKYPPVIKKQEGELQWFCQPVNDEFSYGVIVGRRKKDSVTRIVWKIVSSEDGDCWMEQGKQQVLGALSAGDELFDSHKKWWKDYF